VNTPTLEGGVDDSPFSSSLNVAAAPVPLSRGCSFNHQLVKSTADRWLRTAVASLSSFYRVSPKRKT